MSLLEKIKGALTKQVSVGEKPDDIRIPGIYLVCDRLGLTKRYRQENEGKMMLVAMSSGRDAIYEYVDSERARNTDWDFHVFRFKRYVIDGHEIDLPRYSSHPVSTEGDKG